jgi:hypothetical protein
VATDRWAKRYALHRPTSRCWRKRTMAFFLKRRPLSSSMTGGTLWRMAPGLCRYGVRVCTIPRLFTLSLTTSAVYNECNGSMHDGIVETVDVVSTHRVISHQCRSVIAARCDSPVHVIANSGKKTRSLSPFKRAGTLHHQFGLTITRCSHHCRRRCYSTSSGSRAVVKGSRGHSQRRQPWCADEQRRVRPNVLFS